MSNMSYCRFQNTLPDLRDCRDALDDGALDGNLSAAEMDAAKALILLCEQIFDVYGDSIK
jgi:hypothetical protein